MRMRARARTQIVTIGVYLYWSTTARSLNVDESRVYNDNYPHPTLRAYLRFSPTSSLSLFPVDASGLLCSCLRSLALSEIRKIATLPRNMIFYLRLFLWALAGFTTTAHISLIWWWWSIARLPWTRPNYTHDYWLQLTSLCTNINNYLLRWFTQTHLSRQLSL